MKYRDWILPYVKQYKYRLSGILLLSLLTIGSACALLFTSGYLISKSSLRPDNILLVYVPIVLVRTFGIGRSVFRYSERLVSHDWILRVLANMRSRLYQLIEPHIIRDSVQFKTGEVLGVLAEDIEALQDLYLRTILPAAAAILIYIFSVIALGYFSASFAILMAVYLFILVIAMPLFSMLHVRAAHQAYKQQKDTLYQHVTDAVLGISDWILSGQKKRFFQSYAKLEESLDKKEGHTKEWTYYREFIAQIIVAAMIVTAIVFSSLLFQQHQIPGVFIAAFVLVIFPLSEAVVPVANALEKWPRYEESLKRIIELENMLLVEETASQPLECVPDAVSIKAENLSFKYGDSDKDVLQDITLSVKQGKKIAIIGKSGAGKTTLLKLFQGIASPTKGTITINEIPIDLMKNDFPKLISVLNQNPYLFNTSVANNLLLAKEDATTEEVYSVMKQVKLHELIKSLPEGYQTSMEETGQRFSGGERHRIALARILLQNTPIVMLDEPTVGLDSITERALLATIFETLKGKTLIWITHHLVGMEQMDEILFMQNGQITMRGTHQELLESNEHYRKLYELDRPSI
ncbi:thiol reductant ABC exporter subunit CydC [Heyndrickxia acidicola]|uniref:Thiol reductant ABC exporter subunit CydC n=1 Tax=Heyndrickxia acidicola TaxID=209389 RepID=A0ABU6MG45_9BACI|nr:thiol reductant ABC exporter subunit CydC [Heyndrickxia acidicola]MED1203665.1 thiol reductant ABC exporter subunit CydC [Heyndrickxia acidicola]